MKTFTLVLALSTFCFCATQAQDLPNDLTAISQADAPAFGTYYSIAYWPDYPPLPWNAWDSGADLYYSPTYGTSYIWVDDRAKVAGRMLTESVDPPPIPGGDDGGGPDYFPPQPYYDWSTNFTDLWIWLDSYTNAGDGMTYFFTIHNTTPNTPYEIISSTNVAAPMNPTNWYSEGVWLATSTNLSAYVPMGSKTNRNFFRAHLWSDFIYGVPTNGQVFMQSVTNSIYPVINGVTNHLTPFWSNWFVLNPRPTNIYALNLGYAAEDFGFTNSIVNTNPPQQILRFVGLSKTITNLCLSSNLLTTLNISGWPALQDIEAWHNTNMLTVYVTNCPQLRRACFEAIATNTIGITNVLDFSGCNHLEEIRAANNRFPNIIITNGAGPELWHLCIHDNNLYNQLPSNFNFSVFPSLRDVWIWDNDFAGALPLQNSIATNLVGVEAFNNKFTSLDVSGQTNFDHVYIDGNITLTNLNISGCSKIRQITAQACGLSQSSVDSILISADQSGVHNTGTGSTLFIDLSLGMTNPGTNAVPSLDGQRAAANLLLNKHWTVFYHLPPVGTPDISAVSVPAVGSNSVKITWTTDVASDSTVYYSTSYSSSGASYTSYTDPASVTSHSVTVSGLTAATDYYFFVRSASGGLTGTSGDYQFTTRGGPGIYFVHTSTNVVMQVATNSPSSITWLWADGSSTVGALAVGHGFTNSGISSVVVKPESALTGFGVYCPGDGPFASLDYVAGLTNYPNLQELHLYNSGLTNVSLAGCSNLVSIALVSTFPSSGVENGWLNDIWDAQHTKPGGTTQFGCSNGRYTFYFPTIPGTNATSAVACSNLVRLNWSLLHYP
jgi:hypothetical protein